MSSAVVPVMIRAKADGPIVNASRSVAGDNTNMMTSTASAPGGAEDIKKEICDFLNGIVSYTVYCTPENYLIRIPITLKPIKILREILDILDCAIPPYACLGTKICEGWMYLLGLPKCLCMFLSPTSINPYDLFVCLVCDMSYPPIKLPYRNRPPRHVRLPAGSYPYVWHERSGTGPFIPVPRVSGPPGFSSNIRCWGEGPSATASGRLLSAANPDQLILSEMSDLAITKYGGRTITYTAIGPQR